MGHGTVAEEIKSRPLRAGAAPVSPRRGAGPSGAGRDPRDRGGGGALSLLRRRPRAVPLAGGLDGDAGGAAAPTWRSCSTSARRFNVDREYTQRSTERTHRWLERCLGWHAEHGPAGQLVYGIVQGGVYEDLRRAVDAGGRRERAATGSRSAGRSARRRRRCTRWSATPRASWAGEHERKPRHLLGIGEVDDLISGGGAGDRHLRLRDADAPRQPRHGARPRPGEPLAGGPEEGPLARVRGAAAGGLPCPACADGLSRAYLELSGARRRAHGSAAADDAQPRFPGAA